MRFMLGIVLALGAVPAVAQQRENSARDMMRTMGGAGLTAGKLKEAIEKAETSPLGSQANPVRENMPNGEIAYLRKLRCADGKAPAFARSGSVGTGVFGNIVDLYRVACPGKDTIEVYMDMYHDGPETRPVPGFTMAGSAVPTI